MEKTKSPSSTTRAIVFIIIGLLIGSGIGYVAAVSTRASSSSSSKLVTYTIGLASDLSGGGESFGTETVTSAQIAVTQINGYLAAAGSNVRFALSSPTDTLTTTDGAVSAITTLASAGDDIILCHCWSGQLSAVESYANTNKLVVVSVSSTSNLLAVPKGYLFRMIAPDSFQGKALTTLLWGDGIKNVAVIYRNDAYGQGISGVFQTEFTALGGKVTLEAYDPTLSDFASEVATLASNVQTLGVGKQTAVLFIGFATEAVNIFGHATSYNALTGVRWFSSEGPKGSTILPPTVPASIGQFEVQTNITGTFPQSITNNSIATAYIALFKAQTGNYPQSYGEQAYDSVYLLANSILAVGSENSTAVKNILPTMASHMYGASGPLLLDSNGDKASQDYAIWTIVNNQGTYSFKNIGGWAAATGEIIYNQ
jgi:branched-chain amino acid transport system substrate-binding protein